MSPASGTSDAAAVTNTHGEPGDIEASAHEIGAATSSRLSGDEAMARKMWRRPAAC